MVVAIRQPSEDKEFWHSEMAKEEMVGGVVSGVEEGRPASSAGKLDEEELELDDDSDELETDDDDSLAEDEEPADEDESAEEEEEAETAPVPPPPKPGIIVVANFGGQRQCQGFALTLTTKKNFRFILQNKSLFLHILERLFSLFKFVWRRGGFVLRTTG